MPHKLTLILGGAASGKSVFAENMAIQSNKPRVYLATATAHDAEMQIKINRHITQRGADWTTIEAPLNVEPALAKLSANQICLFDCATLWLSNQMMSNADLNSDLSGVQSTLITALKSCAATVIIVSNEVGHGIVPDNALARAFREAQGRLNIVLATQADLVVQITAGLPTVLKGQMP